MEEKDNVIKLMLLEIIDFLRYKLENDKCTHSDMQEWARLLNSNVASAATIRDLSHFYGQSENNVRNVIARKLREKPERKVVCNFFSFLKIIPQNWITKRKIH